MFTVFLLVMLFVFPLSPRAPHPDDMLDFLLSVLVVFFSCVFVFVPFGVSSGSPMFDLDSRACSWLSPCLVPRNV